MSRLQSEIITLTSADLERLIQKTVRDTVSEFTRNRVPPILNKAQLADYLGKTTATINRYMRKGMPFRKEDNGYPEFYKPDVDRWVKERFEKCQSLNDSVG